MNILQQLRDSTKIFLAQSALHLEGIHLDSVDTLDLINSENKKVFEVDEEDAIILRNVIDALDFLYNIDFSNVKIDINLYIKLNSILAKEQALFVGKLRDIPTSIGCVDEPIQVYDQELIINEVEKLNCLNSDNFKKIIPEVFCSLSRMQPFFDGNKRSTNFLCNVALIKSNLGLFIIDYDNLKDFNIHLRNYYQGINVDIFNFIEEKLIKTNNEIEIEYKKEIKQENLVKTSQDEIDAIIKYNLETVSEYINKCGENNNYPYLLCIDSINNTLYIDINIPNKEGNEDINVIDKREGKRCNQKILHDIKSSLKKYLLKDNNEIDDNLVKCNNIKYKL